MSRSTGQPENEFDTLPDALAADLRAAYGRNVDVPSAIDAAVLRGARAGFARRRRFRLALRGATVTAAAAAAIVLAFAIPMLMKSAPQRVGPTPVVTDTKMLMVAPPPPTQQREDVDRDGKVDILDAFVVAKLVEARGQLDRAYDINGDGRIDGADVDRIAMAAVDASGDGHDRRVQ